MARDQDFVGSALPPVAFRSGEAHVATGEAALATAHLRSAVRAIVRQVDISYARLLAELASPIRDFARSVQSLGVSREAARAMAQKALRETLERFGSGRDGARARANSSHWLAEIYSRLERTVGEQH